MCQVVRAILETSSTDAVSRIGWSLTSEKNVQTDTRLLTVERDKKQVALYTTLVKRTKDEQVLVPCEIFYKGVYLKV